MSQDIKCISFVNPKGKKVLIVDFDPRANATLALGIDSSTLKKSIYDVVLSCCGYNQNTQNKSFILKQMISDIYILIDLPSSAGQLMIEKISVPEDIDKVCNLIKTNAEQRNVTLNKEIDPSLEFIEADRNQFKQILLNLMRNAVKFSKDEGGAVIVKAKRVEDSAQFSVSDTGIGIRDEDMDKLFGLFHQIDSGISRRYGGGVGLAITKQLVEQHGDRIWAESKYGEGSTFTLPLEAKKE